LLRFTSIPYEDEATKLWFAKVIPVVFHVADGQNFGWLNDASIVKET